MSPRTELELTSTIIEQEQIYKSKLFSLYFLFLNFCTCLLRFVLSIMCPQSIRRQLDAKTNWKLHLVLSAIFTNFIQVSATERCRVFVLFPQLSPPALSIILLTLKGLLIMSYLKWSSSETGQWFRQAQHYVSKFNTSKGATHVVKSYSNQSSDTAGPFPSSEQVPVIIFLKWKIQGRIKEFIWIHLWYILAGTMIMHIFRVVLLLATYHVQDN